MANKSIVVARQDFINDLVGVINAYKLPAFVKVEIMERALSQLKSLEDAELQQELTRYNQELNDSAEEHDKEGE